MALAVRGIFRVGPRIKARRKDRHTPDHHKVCPTLEIKSMINFSNANDGMHPLSDRLHQETSPPPIFFLLYDTMHSEKFFPLLCMFINLQHAGL